MSGFGRIALFADDYGLPMLRDCVPHIRIACVVRASIRPEQRPAMESLAAELGVPLLAQPPHKSPDYAGFISAIRRLEVDLILCNSYSMLLRDDVLKAARYRAVNAHASLLPRNRGPNPIQWAIIRGESETGVTLHVMNQRFDAGPLLYQRIVAIDKLDTWSDLRMKLTEATRGLWRERISEILDGNWVEIPQNEEAASVNCRLNEESPRIDFAAMTDDQIYDLIRAQVAPLAGAYVELADGRRVRFRERVPLERIGELRRRYSEK